MKKNNKQTSQRGLKRDAKNKARKKRAEALYEFNDLANRVKLIYGYLNKEEDI